MSDLAYKSLRQLSQLIADGQLGSEELLDHTLARVDRFNPELNAIVVERREEARAVCRAADSSRARGESLGPLHGIPITVKEAYDVVGTASTWGMPVFADHSATEDAVLIQRLQDNGAAVYGKSNVPLMLADLQSFNEVYGQTNNPWDKERIPGGSSGGSAASLAAGFTPLEMGSDIGGSIRNPSHFCGTFGHKPTFNLLPQRGHAPPGPSLNIDIAVCGPMARTADDLALAMDLLAYPDEIEQTGIQYELPPLFADGVDELKIALWDNESIAPVSSETAGRVNELGRKLQDLGAEVDNRARPDFNVEDAWYCYSQLLHSTLAAGTPDDEYNGMREAAAQLPPNDRSELGTFLQGSTRSHRDWMHLDGQRTLMRRAWHEFFADYDAIIMPVFGTGAFHHDHNPKLQERTINVDNQQIPYMKYVFWAGLSGVSYLPSTVIPTGPGADGMPIGLQIVGPEYGDYITIGIAAMLERLGYRFQIPPGYES